MSRLFAAIYEWGMGRTERAGLADWRRELLSQAEGRVLELGAGTGLNLPHFPEQVSLVLSEPDRHMRARLERRLDLAGRKAEVLDASAESLPFPDASLDTVVSTLVLCSVPDPQAAIHEVARVLRPGGRFLFLEHVASKEPGLRRWQDRLEPVWCWCAEGCRLTRDPRAEIEASGLSFEACEDDELPAAYFFLKPAVRGCARKPA